MENQLDKNSTPTASNEDILAEKIKQFNNEMIAVTNIIKAMLEIDGAERPLNAESSTESLTETLNKGLIDALQGYGITSNKYKFIDFLELISNITQKSLKKEHKQKICNIFSLDFLKNKIKEFISKEEIYQIFNFNMPVLLYLLENGLIDFKQIEDNIGYHSVRFFYPELYRKYSKELKEKDEVFFESKKKIADYLQKKSLKINTEEKLNEFIKNRQEYHSNVEIAKIIREDNIDRFTDYVSQSNLDLNSDTVIKKSTFEQDSFLNFRYNKSLICYAAIFGSLKIFKFLFINETVNLPNELVCAAIIGGNYEIIHILENCDKNRFLINWANFDLMNAVNYHRNEIFCYLQEVSGLEYNDYLFCCSIRYSNYEIFNKIIEAKPEFISNKPTFPNAIMFEQGSYLDGAFAEFCSCGVMTLFEFCVQTCLDDININLKRDVKIFLFIY